MTTIYSHSKRSSLFIWACFSASGLMWILDPQPPAWLGYVWIALMAVVFLWRFPRCGIYLDGDSLVLRSVVLARRVPIDEIVRIRKPPSPFFPMALDMKDGTTIRVSHVPANARTRGRVFNSIEQAVANSLSSEIVA